MLPIPGYPPGESNPGEGTSHGFYCVASQWPMTGMVRCEMGACTRLAHSQTPTIRSYYADDRSKRRNRRCGAVWGCEVLSGNFLRTASCGIYTNSYNHIQPPQRGERKYGSPHLGSGAPRRFRSAAAPAAQCWVRTGPRPELLEESRAFGCTGAWRQFLEPACDTERSATEL